jgi:hypothetical protein
MKLRNWMTIVGIFGLMFCFGDKLPAVEPSEDWLADHPRPSYDDVKEIDAMEAALRESLAGNERYSFSRGWWGWDRLRCRYVDRGRKEKNTIRILRAVFRGLVLDWHAKLKAKGEGDLFYIFFVTEAPGDKTVRKLGNRKLIRDLHGGGYHGGWGSAARMRIYEELVRQEMLTMDEMKRFKQIVHQSLSSRFLDFEKGAQRANNHSFGNAGGVAIALRLFPDAPQAREARAWLDRVWGDFSQFKDWKEWNYYPYGPIFLHGMVDLAEERGAFEKERDLLYATGLRCLGFVHGGGLRGNPNSGAPVQGPAYADPWQGGYYRVEQNARDGHFWYRMAKHFKDPMFLWAAEQVILGGKPPGGRVHQEYVDAYNKRFAWFNERRIKPQVPPGTSSIGYLSALRHKIPERLYLGTGRQAGRPFVSFFLYDQKDEHLDNVSGHLYEYVVNGAKFLHTSGKYNNVYDGSNKLRGGGTGEESLDLFLVIKRGHDFPLHPDRLGGKGDYMRRGSIEHLDAMLKVESNGTDDSFGQFAFNHYYGPGSCWTRRAVLTAEGYLVVLDRYVGGAALGDGYHGGPVWHLARNKGRTDGPSEQNFFDAPALDYAWWQTEHHRVILYLHDDGQLRFGSRMQTKSQDIPSETLTVFSYKPVSAAEPSFFLSVLVPCVPGVLPEEVAGTIKTIVDHKGNAEATIGRVWVTVNDDGNWAVQR